MSKTNKADVVSCVESTKGIHRRGFLQLGAGVAALAIGSACSGPLGMSKDKLLLSDVASTYSGVDPSELGDVITNIGSTYTELVIDQATYLRDSTGSPQDVTIPNNVELVVNKEGMIHLENKHLKVKGAFRAGSYKVFEVGPSTSVSLEHPYDVGGSTTISGDSTDVFLANGTGASRQNLVVFGDESSQSSFIKSVDASWYGLVSDGQRVFSDYSTSGTDNWASLQRAMFSAIVVGRVFVPAGNYLIKDTLHIKDLGEGSLYRSLVLEGAGLGETALILDDSVTDRPLIDIEYGRGCQVRSLSLLGCNRQPLVESAAAMSGDPGQWISSGFTAGPFHPHCAIATDAFAGPAIQQINEDLSTYNGAPASTPGSWKDGNITQGQPWTASDLYPVELKKGRTYDKSKYHDLTGLTYATGSQDITVEDVSIDGFVVGVAIAPSSSLQNDTIRVKRSRIRACVYGVSVGTSQARGFKAEDNLITACHTAFDNVHFGERSGCMFSCTNNIYGSCHMLYFMSPTSGGGGLIAREYCEGTVRIGRFGLTGGVKTVDSIQVSGCNFFFKDRRSMQVLVTRGNMLFEGCTFDFFGTKAIDVNDWDDDGIPNDTDTDDDGDGTPDGSDTTIDIDLGRAGRKGFHIVTESSNSQVSFQSCSFHSRVPEQIGFFINSGAERKRLHFSNCTLVSSPVGTGAAALNTIFLSDTLPVRTESGEKTSKVPSRVPIHYTTQSVSFNNKWHFDRQYDVVYQTTFPLFVKTVSGSWSYYSDRIAFTLLNEGELLDGDWIYWTVKLTQETQFDGSLSTSVILPILRVEVDSTDAKKIVARIPYEYQAEAEVDLSRTGSTSVELLPYHDWANFYDKTNARNEYSPTNLVYTTKSEFEARYPGTPVFSSRFYVIQDYGDSANQARGTFASGNNTVTGVANPHLLEVGDLVNADFVGVGTRIKEINPVYDPGDNVTITSVNLTLTQNATASGTDQIPAFKLKS